MVEKQFCSKDDVMRALSIQTGHPVLRLDMKTLQSKLVHVLPVRSAEKLRAVPLRLEGKRGEVLVAAVAAPADMETLDALRTVSGKSRVVVHLAHDDEIERAIAKLYYGKEDEPPPAEPPPTRPVGIATEAELELAVEEESKDATPARPVRMFGWHEAAMRALQMMIQRSGIPAEPVADDQLETLGPDEVLIASTLGLQSALPPGTRLSAQLIICGVKDDLDIADAKACGARIYLRPPFSTEQLQGAIQRCQRLSAPAEID